MRKLVVVTVWNLVKSGMSLTQIDKACLTGEIKHIGNGRYEKLSY